MRNDPKRKVKPSSTLRGLTLENQKEVIEYLFTHSYRETIEWLKECGVPTSSSALVRFRRWFPKLQQHMANEQAAREAMAKKKQENPNMTDEELYRHGQRVFAELTLEERNVEGWARTQLTEQRRRKLGLEVKKFQYSVCEIVLELAEDDRMKEIARKPVSYTEKLQMLGKVIFGNDW